MLYHTILQTVVYCPEMAVLRLGSSQGCGLLSQADEPGTFESWNCKLPPSIPRPELSIIWALFWDGGGIEGRILGAYDQPKTVHAATILHNAHA